MQGRPGAVRPVVASSVLMPEAVCHRGSAQGAVTGSEGGAGSVLALRSGLDGNWLSGERWPVSFCVRGSPPCLCRRPG